MGDRRAVEMKGICHRFGKRMLFDRLDATFEKEKITALSGKSGSGKSTLLQMINGLVRPDAGALKVNGAPLDYRRIHRIRLGIGYAVQQVGLFPHLKVYDNIALPGKLAKKDKRHIRHRVDRLMELMGLSRSHAQKYPHMLSGGEQQRVGLCRAILLDPPLMLLDEPFSSLDKDTKAGIYEELLALQRQEPRCIILVTHDPAEADLLGDARFWFRDNKLCSSPA